MKPQFIDITFYTCQWFIAIAHFRAIIVCGVFKFVNKIPNRTDVANSLLHTVFFNELLEVLLIDWQIIFCFVAEVFGKIVGTGTLQRNTYQYLFADTTIYITQDMSSFNFWDMEIDPIGNNSCITKMQVFADAPDKGFSNRAAKSFLKDADFLDANDIIKNTIVGYARPLNQAGESENPTKSSVNDYN